jgi:hypothetical protein
MNARDPYPSPQTAAVLQTSAAIGASLAVAATAMVVLALSTWLLGLQDHHRVVACVLFFATVGAGCAAGWYTQPFITHLILTPTGGDSAVAAGGTEPTGDQP